MNHLEFKIKATEKRHVAPVEEECNVDVHASRDAVGCPAHAQNKLGRAPHHTTLPFRLASSSLPQLSQSHSTTLLPSSSQAGGFELSHSLRFSPSSLLYDHDPSVTSFEPCKTCSTSRARPRIPPSSRIVLCPYTPELPTRSISRN
jgi:hypothetical protein